MNAPAPSPADLARRTPTPPPAPKPGPRPAPPASRIVTTARATPMTPEQAITPGRLAPSERFKPTYHRGLLLSGMHPEARLMGYTLLWYANHSSGRISPNFQPSREQLAQDTGLDIHRVGVQLEVLRQRGWLHLTRIKEGPRTGLPRFDLTIPALHLERVREHRAEQTPPDQPA